jgi:hypothetical protein
MEHRIAMIEAENNHLRYELSRLSCKWELIGVRNRLDRIGLAMAPREYLMDTVRYLARSLALKMCENLEECINKRLPEYAHFYGDTIDVRLVAPRFTETSVEVTIR